MDMQQGLRVRKTLASLGPRLSLGGRLTLSIGALIALAGLALFLGLYRVQERQILDQIDAQAGALLSEMLVVRQWVAEYGGVWTTQAGEYYLEGRDGFFRKSPAMVTKELSSLSNASNEYRFHITSLRLLNPKNAPDPFELEGLHQFEWDARPLSQIEVVDGQRVYRSMIPLYTEAACLECHASQGYQVGDIRGGLSVAVPMADIDRSLAAGRRGLIASVVIIVALVMGVLYWLVRRLIIAPVGQLEAAALAIGQGDYDARCDIHTGDELEVLGQTFNQMVDSLKASRDALQGRVTQRTRELAALSDVALTISRSGALEDVLGEALGQVTQAAGMDGGGLHLVGADGTLSLVASQGVSASVTSCMSALSAGEGFPSQVIQREMPFLQPDLSAGSCDEGCPRGECRLAAEGYGALVSVPLRSRDRTLGTLTLMRRQAGEISPELVGFLTCVGNQLGVAVENAHFQERVEQVAILDERGRIARELHDSLAQTLGWLNLKTETLVGTLEGGDVPAARNEARTIHRVVRHTCYDIRESIDGLRVQPVGDLVPSVAAYVSDFGRRNGLLTDFVASDGECYLTPVAETEVLRILQEALTNVRKHAHAERVEVRLQGEAQAVELEVADDGRGFDPATLPPEHHYGLRIMRERAERVGGSFQVQSGPGAGTRVIARLPTGLTSGSD
jgi:two-component system nitrate/nitrite sensor histidine kinase NarX